MVADALLIDVLCQTECRMKKMKLEPSKKCKGYSDKKQIAKIIYSWYGVKYFYC